MPEESKPTETVVSPTPKKPAKKSAKKPTEKKTKKPSYKSRASGGVQVSFFMSPTLYQRAKKAADKADIATRALYLTAIENHLK